jgi:hypothetical protein
MAPMRVWTAIALGVLSTAAAVGIPAGVRAAPPATKTVVDEPYPDDFKARVQAELAAGVRRMRRHIVDGGGAGWNPGERALWLLTLVKCGVPLDDKDVVATFAALRKAPPKKTYDVGASLLAIGARYDGPYDAFATDVVDAAGRHVVPPPTTDVLDPEDRAWMTAGVEFLVKAQRRRAQYVALNPRGRKGPPPVRTPNTTVETKGWGYPNSPSNDMSGWIDVSNTQYALLGLKAASRCGIPVPEATWETALELLLAWQQPTGPAVDWRGNEVRGAARLEWKEPARARGFSYDAPAATTAGVTGGRTAAGAVGLMICQSELRTSARWSEAHAKRTREAVRDVLAWLQVSFRADLNPGDNEYWVAPEKRNPDLAFYDPYHASYLYAVERTAVLCHLRFLGQHDWYREGAEVVLAARATKGRVVPDADLCFEMLFLKRASFRSTIPVTTPEVGPAADGRGAPPPGK